VTDWTQIGLELYARGWSARRARVDRHALDERAEEFLEAVFTAHFADPEERLFIVKAPPPQVDSSTSSQITTETEVA
jgi:hypothetical protein